MTKPKLSEEKRKRIIREVVSGGQKLTDTDIQLLEYKCQKLGIDPLDGLIVPTIRKSKDGYGGYKSRTIYITTIELLRRIRDMSGLCQGCEIEFKYSGKNNQDLVSAICTIHKGTESAPRWAKFRYEAFLSEYGLEYGKPKKGGFWGVKDHIQLGKCAEAGATRMAFPLPLPGIYIGEEISEPESPPSSESPSPSPPSNPPETRQKPPSDVSSFEETSSLPRILKIDDFDRLPTEVSMWVSDKKPDGKTEKKQVFFAAGTKHRDMSNGGRQALSILPSIYRNKPLPGCRITPEDREKLALDAESALTFVNKRADQIKKESEDNELWTCQMSEIIRLVGDGRTKEGKVITIIERILDEFDPKEYLKKDLVRVGTSLLKNASLFNDRKELPELKTKIKEINEEIEHQEKQIEK